MEANQQPTIFEQAYWDADDEQISQAWEALLVAPDTVSEEKLTEFVELTWHLAVQNRLRQKDIALKLGEVSMALEAMQPKKRVRVPKQALPELSDEPEQVA